MTSPPPAKRSFIVKLFSHRSKCPPKQQALTKRRIVVNLALSNSPLRSRAEFFVDPRYRDGHLIGAGTFGVVISALDERTHSRVAIKQMPNPFSSSHLARHTLRELRLLRHLRHPNIVKLLDIDVPAHYDTWDQVHFVTPLLEFDLKQALTEGRVEAVKDQKKVAFQLLQALEHMHAVGVMHRDVKAGNLLLDNNLNVQLCDLGEARFYSKVKTEYVEPQNSFGNEPALSAAIGTVIQSAPELSLGADYDAEVDIWAAGCVIAQIVHPEHNTLFDNTGKRSHVQEIIDVVGYPPDDIVEILPGYGVAYLKSHRVTKLDNNRVGELLGPDPDPLVIDLLEKMLRFSPRERVSASTALEHEWFDEVRAERPSVMEKYDFAQSEPPTKISKADLKALIWKEVVAMHPEAEELGIH